MSVLALFDVQAKEVITEAQVRVNRSMGPTSEEPYFLACSQNVRSHNYLQEREREANDSENILY